MKSRLVFLGVFAVLACNTVQQPGFYSRQGMANCYQQFHYDYHEDQVPKPLHTLDIPEIISDNFSFTSTNIANSMGILGLLESYLNSLESFSSNPSLENRLRHLELYQQLSQQIEFAELEISSVSSELNCEEERIYQVANYLKTKENTKTDALTVTSIVVAGIGSILTVVLIDEGNAAEYTALGAGIVGATLGFMILVNKKQVEFYHDRNHLREIWEGPKVSTYFPESVWYYLTYSEMKMDSPMTKREQIIEGWKGIGILEETKPKKVPELVDRFFGNGGIYDSKELTERANMYDQLNAQINLMLQDLKILSLGIERFQSKKLKGWVGSSNPLD